MCLLFYHLNEEATSGSFRLILANIRDEYWDRPTLPSGFWINNPCCIGGIDLQNERQGGTWLAMNRQGKIGILLNILEKEPKEDMLSRGVLVSDYIMNKEVVINKYMDAIASKSDQFNLFSLVLFDLKLKSTYYYTNKCKSNVPEQLKAGTYAFGNTERTKPWRKVTAGKKIFQDIVAKFSKVEDKKKLKTALFDLLTSEERHFDKNAAAEFPDKDYLTSYIHNREKNIRYGTRTQSIILIDHDGKCQFLEKTLETPVVVDNYKWELSNHSFNLNLN